ncbi:hypothetical protein IFO70_37775 [Phormidium tenue FACHB-886]|nr:hypothetical protein [Phormidium tenue FACHB-886]
MTAVNNLDLAKQGNSKAIAALINQPLHPKGITAKAIVSDNCLTVVAEANTLPDKSFLLDFVRRSFVKVTNRLELRLLLLY